MKAFYLSIIMALALLPAHAQRRYNAMKETKKEFFKTEQARLIGDQILDYQRVTGGWPQFWPGMRGYQVHITFNDDAMVNTMEMLRDIYLQKAPFDGKLTDKALDPCPWGLRVYYYGCEREGGDSGWLRDNLDQAPGHPAFHGLTALWIFDGKWDPKARIRDLCMF